MIKLATLLKEIQDVSKILKEIGDASAKPYEWELGYSSLARDTNYEFTTDLGTEYKVNFSTLDYLDKDTNEWIDGVYIMFLVAYHLDQENSQDIEVKDTQTQSPSKRKKERVKDVQDTTPNKYWSTIIATNKGELYRVMATITKIVQEFLKNNPTIKVLIYEPSKKSSEKEFGLQRDILYKAFIKQAFPSAEISNQENNIIVKIK
jgi:hypothetical protein